MRAEETNDFSLFVTSFYLKLTGIWSATSPEEQRQRWNAFIFSMTFMVLGAYTELRELYYAWDDSFEDTIFALCNVVTVILVLCKIFTLYLKRTKFCELLTYSENNFWHLNYDPHERIYLDECRKMSILFICFFNFFAQGTALSYTIESFVGYFGNNMSARTLPFNLHTDFVMKPYIYEVTFLSQIFVLVAYGIGYLCVDNFMCIANFHVATQFRILQYRIVSIQRGCKMEKFSGISRPVPDGYTDNFYMIFKDCIKQHQSLIAYCEKVEDVFTLVVLGQVLLFSILICLDGYLMLMEEASPYRRMVFTFHLIGCISQLLMFTYSCDCVLRESMEIAESVYNTRWTISPFDTGGKMLRTDLQLVMVRSRVPCCMTAGGFFIVSLETYTKVLSTAASYFTLLRQY
ncbi:odorant receptor 13a-like [Augochlora pura]